MLVFMSVLLSRIKVSVRAEKGSELSLKCTFWFIELFRLPMEKKEESKERENKSYSKESIRDTIGSLNIRIDSYDDVMELLHALNNVLSRFKKLIKHVVIKNTECSIVVVGSDAADTAIKYGAVCSAAYPAVTLLSECFTFKPDKIDISAGFAEHEMYFSLKTDASVRLIYLLAFAVSAIVEFIKFKKELE